MSFSGVISWGFSMAAAVAAVPRHRPLHRMLLIAGDSGVQEIDALGRWLRSERCRQFPVWKNKEKIFNQNQLELCGIIAQEVEGFGSPKWAQMNGNVAEMV